MTEHQLAELCRKAAARSRSGRTFLALGMRADAWDLKFKPDQPEILLYPADFANDDLIVEEIVRRLDALPIDRAAKSGDESNADDRLGAMDT